MTAHDKYCDSRTHESWCDCRKIDAIRADERRQMEMAAVIDREEIADEVRERIAREIEALHYPEAVFAYEVKADAARIARGGTR